jgi:pimeloyl-ACP methyl ester carboxylesterase
VNTGSPSEEYVTVAGARIHLRRGGQGRPLVWLHSVEGDLGWLQSHRLLAERFTVYAPTYPGFGASERPPWLETVADLARFNLWLLQELGLERVILAGHFLGGWLAAEMAVMCPHVVDRLVLVDAAGLKPETGEILDIFLYGVAETRRLSFFDAEQAPEYAAHFGRERTSAEKEIELRDQEMATRLCWKPYMYDPSLPHLLPRLRTPALVVWGREDRIVPLECAERYQRAIPGARLAVIERCGHLPHLERPRELAAQVLDFLA